MRWRRWLKEGVVTLLMVWGVSVALNWYRSPKEAPQTLPHATLKLLDGKQYTLKKGKPVLVHFWATWCRVCKAEAQNIERLSKEVEVVTIVVGDEPKAAIQAYMQKHHLSFRVYHDKNGVWAKRYGVRLFPTTFIYAADGSLAFSEVGYTTTAGLLARVKLLR